MDHTQHNAIVNFLWGIADDVLKPGGETEGLVHRILEPGNAK